MYLCVSVIFKGLPVEVLGVQLLLLPEVDSLVQYYSIASILCEVLCPRFACLPLKALFLLLN